MRVRGTNLLIMMLLVCSVLLLSLPTVSSPREHRLSDLVESSDLVAVADVVEVTDLPASGSPEDPLVGFPRVARLAPVTVWKGRDVASISVPFTECLSWPAGPTYVEGERVVVFLRESPDGWATVDLARLPSDSTWGPLDSLDIELLGHGPGATCLPGLSIQRTGTVIP